LLLLSKDKNNAQRQALNQATDTVVSVDEKNFSAQGRQRLDDQPLILRH
jgi:hypothetical protein